MIKIITIAQQKGGTGKTTIAAHIATALTQSGKRVAIIDIDPQGSLTEWYKLREQKFGTGFTGLKFVACSGWRLESTIRELKRLNDYIIIDSPPHIETEAKSAIRIADLIVIPMQPSPADLWATSKTLTFAKSENKLAKIILNRLNSQTKISQSIIGKLKEDIFQSSLGNRVAFSSCFLNGTTVHESFPRTAAAWEIKNLTEEILNIMEKVNQEETEELEEANY